MTAIRIIDDHTELATIGTNTHAQIDTHITAASDYVKRDGSLALTADWDIGNGLKIIADHIRARDADGLKLYDDGGNGIFVEDGGKVGIGTAAPARNLHVHNSGSPITTIQVTNSLSGITSRDGMVFGLSSSNDAQFWIFEDIDFYIGTAGTERLRIKNGGNVGIATSSPTAKLDVNSDIVRLRTAKTPATEGSAGNRGDICWDADYVYVCVATNTWKRSALSTW